MQVVSRIQELGGRAFRQTLLMAGSRLYRRDAYVQKVAALHSPLRIIIGAGGTRYPGWIATDITRGPERRPLPFRLAKDPLPLDITNAAHWAKAFEKGTITSMLCEHVFEHLSDAEIEAACANCLAYLAVGGRLRIAVPDGRRPDQRYIEGIAPPADGHLQLFTIESMTALLARAGFAVEALEYYNDAGDFVRNAYDEADGIILRCYARDRQVDFAFRDHHYTSIIVDAVKRGF